MLDAHRLALLREFQARGTIAAVAEATRFSPSAVSQHLTQLEREAGTKLFEKAGRRVRLTPAGERLALRADDVAAALERAESELRESDVPSGTLRVGVFQSAMLALIPAALRLMSAQAPEVRVEVVQREPETALRETWMREFDMVVAEHYPAHAAPHYPGLDRRALMTDLIQLAVPNDSVLPGSSGGVGGAGVGVGVGGAGVGGAGLASARDAAWVMEPRGAASRHYAEQLCRMAGFEPDVRYETADLQAHVTLVESGNAVALLPDLIWAGATPRATLLPLDDAPRRTIFTAARRAGADFPAIAAFREVLEQTAAGLSVR
ncbi:LysR family transcriptional regulator (plasmid) [Coraliomargarita sp. W4R53]